MCLKQILLSILIVSQCVDTLQCIQICSRVCGVATVLKFNREGPAVYLSAQVAGVDVELETAIKPLV